MQPFSNSYRVSFTWQPSFPLEKAHIMVGLRYCFSCESMHSWSERIRSTALRRNFEEDFSAPILPHPTIVPTFAEKSWPRIRGLKFYYFIGILMLCVTILKSRFVSFSFKEGTKKWLVICDDFVWITLCVSHYTTRHSFCQRPATF